MKYKFLLGIVLSIFIIGLCCAAEQQSLGSFNLNKCINLTQICANCSYVNISSVLYPNSTKALGETKMIKAGTDYSYYFCSTSLFGQYIVNGHGDENGVNAIWNYVFDIAPAQPITTAIALFYVGILGVLCFFFVLCILLLGTLPSEDPRGNDGNIMSINNLKYLKYPIGGFAWGILVIISFVIFNFAEGYIMEYLIRDVFKMIFQLLLISATIGIPVILWFMFAKFMQDQVIKRMIERNIMTE